MIKNIYYKINCTNLGDVLCATPVIRKLYKLYNSKINIINDSPEVLQNSPYIEKIISSSVFKKEEMISPKEYFESFVLPGQRNQFSIERKFNTFDIRQIHAHDLGFSLMPEEMNCDFFPLPKNKYDLPKKYVVLHTAKNWPNRSWTQDNWQKLINYLCNQKIYVVLIGKETVEKDFHTINKSFYNFHIPYGINLINKTNISDCWHIINDSESFITFDTGPLHLAGTTNANIIHLGSAKDPRLVAPYRFGAQNYKYKNIKGTCELYCTNNLKYSIKEWNSINYVPPLINCLENKASFECQPNPNQVIEYLKSIF